MDNWTGWAAAILSFVLTILGVNYRMDKKRNEDNAKACIERDSALAERITKVEAELVTDKEVRELLKDHFDPFMTDVRAMQRDMQDIKVSIARLGYKEDN